MVRQALLMFFAASAPVAAQGLKAYGTVTDHFGTPVAGGRIVVTAVDISPGVPQGERVPVGAGQCAGARPVSAGALAGADGRFRMRLPLDAPAPALVCLAIETIPPAGKPLMPIHLALDSVRAAALAAAGDSVRLDVIVLDATEGVPDDAPPPTPPPTFARPDDELLWLQRAVPGGFGGYWRAGAGQPVNVYLTDMTQAARAKKVLLRYFQVRPPAGGAPPDVRFMRGRWDARTLLAWRDRLRALGRPAGVLGAELRLDWNRVQARVSGPAARARLRRRLPALGIPEEALFIVGAS